MRMQFNHFTIIACNFVWVQFISLSFSIRLAEANRLRKELVQHLGDRRNPDLLLFITIRAS